MRTSVIIILLAVSIITCHGQGITTDSIRIRPSARSWVAFIGAQKIGEIEVFDICGKPDLAAAADEYQQDRARGLLIGGLLAVAGQAVMISAFNTSENINQTYLIGGAVVSSAGLWFLIRQLTKPSKCATYETALSATGAYNLSYRK